MAKGQALIRLEDPLRIARVRVLEAQLDEARLRYGAAQVDDLANARIYAEHVRNVEAKLDVERARETDLVVRAEPGGSIRRARMPNGLVGKCVAKGEKLGYVIDDERAGSARGRAAGRDRSGA